MGAGFHEVRFPMRLALSTSGGPVRRTDIVNLSNGRESRNRRWQNSRRSYDVGSGIRSVSDLAEVLAFFEARGGECYGFRFPDPVDATSAPFGAAISALDQPIGTGDGVTASFQLTKTYGDAGGQWTRLIAKPVAGSVVVSVNGVAVPPTGFGCDSATGRMTFLPGHVPAAAAAVRAGFAFDVPVRFASDRLDLNRQAFAAGHIPSIPLLEITP